MDRVAAVLRDPILEVGIGAEPAVVVLVELVPVAPIATTDHDDWVEGVAVHPDDHDLAGLGVEVVEVVPTLLGLFVRLLEGSVDRLAAREDDRRGRWRGISHVLEQEGVAAGVAAEAPGQYPDLAVDAGHPVEAGVVAAATVVVAPLLGESAPRPAPHLQIGVEVLGQHRRDVAPVGARGEAVVVDRLPVIGGGVLAVERPAHRLTGLDRLGPEGLHLAFVGHGEGIGAALAAVEGAGADRIVGVGRGGKDQARVVVPAAIIVGHRAREARALPPTDRQIGVEDARPHRDPIPVTGPECDPPVVVVLAILVGRRPRSSPA